MQECFTIRLKKGLQNNRITIPKVIMNKLKNKAGDYLTVKIEKDEKNI